jgi:nucleoside-diphosphate-sugar epimerase
MTHPHALVVGATGIVGQNLAEYLRDLGGWRITGLSRHPAPGTPWISPLACDLLDPNAVSVLSGLSPTHVFYCTWTLGRTEDDNIRLNGNMLRNLLAALAPSRTVEHIGVVTGTKHYLGPFEDYGKTTPVTPFREDAPRLPKKNFYYELEDILIAAAAAQGFGWSVHRAHTIVGHAVGNLMNIGVTLATFASICKATGMPFTFPGSPVAWAGLNDITDARLLARHLHWAATTPQARNEAYNAVNGDVFRWQQLWPRIAAWFDLPDAPYPGQATPLAPRMAPLGPDWDMLVARHVLQPHRLDSLASPWHTDLDLGRPMECLHSMTKSRLRGFTAYQDSEASFTDLFDRLRAERIIP